MNRRILINIIKSDNIIGNIFYIKDYKYTSQVLNDIKKIIENYNKNLISFKDIPDDILAQRMLDKSSMICNHNIWHADICVSSFSYLVENYPGYTFPGQSIRDANRGIIAVLESDILNNGLSSDHIFDIDLDKKKIAMQHAFMRLSESEYCKEFEVSLSDFKIEDFTKVEHLIPTSFYINELSEVLDIFGKHFMGFRVEYSNDIFVPMLPN